MPTPDETITDANGNPVPEPHPESVREVRRFTEAFGPVGAKWYADGRTFEEASELYRARLLAENDQLKAQVAGFEAHA